MSRPPAPAYYADASLGARLHLRARAATCPLAEIDGAVPGRGRILEVGCGRGLVALHLAVASPAREVVGIDPDGRKLATARRAAEQAQADGTRVSFAPGGFGALLPGPWDAVVVVDVLYLLHPAAQQEAVAEAAAALAPGGRLVIKEMTGGSGWRMRLVAWQEWAALRLLHLTAGAGVFFSEAVAIRAWAEAAGLAVEDRPLPGGLHPHHLVVGTRR